jgi:hypothetical protein
VHFYVSKCSQTKQLNENKKRRKMLGYLRLSATTIARAATTSKITMSEYSQLKLNRNQAPPTAIAHNPSAIVLDELRSYLTGLLVLMAPKASIQIPESKSTTGTISVQPMSPTM